VPAPLVSVVIPVRDGADTLPRCLDALAAQQDAPAFEVIVVDNGSTDTTAALAGAHPVVTHVVTEPRPGSYAARNAGVALAAGSVLAFTDADCVPEPGWLAAGAAAVRDVPLAGGRVVAVLERATPVARYDAALYLDQEGYVREQGFAATANLFVRTEVARAVGGFDADLRSGGDLDFCQRAASAGHSITYAADAVVRHRPRSSYGELWRLHRRLGAGWAALARQGKRPPFWRDPALRWPTFEMVVRRVNADGPPLRRRRLALPHVTAMSARWTGRLLGR
jgi:glycosyltransferase involved in cell wall biosynthesis